MKKLLALALALAMLLALTACGGGKTEDVPPAVSDAAPAQSDTAGGESASVPPETAPETASVPSEGTAAVVSEAIEITLPNGERVTDAKLLNGTFYIAANDGSNPDGDPNSFNKIYTAGMDGAAPQLFYTHDSVEGEGLAPSLDGTVWLHTYAWDDEAQKGEFHLFHIGTDGALLADVDLLQLIGVYVDGRDIFPAPDGGVTVLSGENLYVLDSAGAISSSTAITGGYLQSVISLPDGQLAALQQSYALDGSSASALVRVDPAVGIITPIPLKSDQSLDYASPLCADGNELYFLRVNTLYRVDMTTGEQTELSTLVNAGIDSYNMLVCFVKDGRLWSAEAPTKDFSITKSPKGSDTLTLYPARSGEDARTVLTLATMRTDYNLAPLVAKFNRVNPDYRVELKDYSADDPWIEHALEKLNYDIIGGDVPDMFLLDSMPRTTLVKQGLLADLSPYLEADPDIRPEDYLMKIIDAGREDGQLLSLFSSFAISSLAALPGQSVTVENNTLENLFALQTQDPDTAVLLASQDDQNNYLAAFLIYCPDGIIDLENASCSFDGVRFRALAELFANMPLTQYDEVAGTRAEAPYRMFIADLMQYPDIQFDNLNGWTPLLDGGQAPIDQAGSTLVGWPSPDGGVFTVIPRGEFAICSRSAHPDGCWAFLRQYLMDDFQLSASDSGEGFPLKRSALDDLASLYLQYDVMTQEEIDTVNAVFESDRLSVDHPSLLDDIYNIVVEEITPYYDGAVTLDAAIANLQSRVSLYLAEHS